MNNYSFNDIKKRIDSINEELLQIDVERMYRGANLFEGKAGYILYLYYTGVYYDDKLLQNRALDYLDDLIISLNNLEYQSYGLYDGYTGIFWLIKHLVKYDIIDPEYSVLHKDYDEVLTNNVYALLSNRNYDFLHGSLGMIYYLMYNEKDLYLHNELIEKFKKESIKYLKNQVEAKLYGLAHGISGILLLYIYLYENRFSFTSLEAEYLNEIVDDLLTHLRNINPNNVIKDESAFYRFTWCNGNTGIVYALARSLKCDLLKNDYRNEIKELLGYISVLSDHKKLGLIDTCLCHGTAGNLQVFNNLYSRLNIKDILIAVETWANKTMLYGLFKDVKTGYKYWNGSDCVPNYSLIRGLAGTALGLMNYCDKRISSWDEFFLI